MHIESDSKYVERRAWAGTTRRRARVPWAVLWIVPNMPRNIDPTRHEAREGRARPARHGTAQVPALLTALSCSLYPYCTKKMKRMFCICPDKFQKEIKTLQWHKLILVKHKYREGIKDNKS